MPSAHMADYNRLLAALLIATATTHHATALATTTKHAAHATSATATTVTSPTASSAHAATHAATSVMVVVNFFNRTSAHVAAGIAAAHVTSRRTAKAHFVDEGVWWICLRFASI